MTTGDFPPETYYRCREIAAERDRLRAEVEALQRECFTMGQQCIAAIDAEPEFPGELPPHLAQAVLDAMQKEDIEFFVVAMRTAVRMTKDGIRNRMLQAALRGEGEK